MRRRPGLSDPGPGAACRRLRRSRGPGRCGSETAAAICGLQGPEGQWWWHYDTRNGSVVEGYPVYSVHQHAMAPMALLDLREAGGTDHIHVARQGAGLARTGQRGWAVHGLRGGCRHLAEGRAREPKKLVRALSAATTASVPKLKGSGLDTMFPPGRNRSRVQALRVGWLLYAWLSGGTVAALSPDPSYRPHLNRRGEDDMDSGRQLIFGFRFDAMRIEDVVARCARALQTRQRVLIGVLNAAKVVTSRRDRLLRSSLLDCDVLLADGQSIVWASRLLGRGLPERVPESTCSNSFSRSRIRKAAPSTFWAPRPTCWRDWKASSPPVPGAAYRRQPSRIFRECGERPHRGGDRSLGCRHALSRHDVAPEGDFPGHVRLVSRRARCCTGSGVRSTSWPARRDVRTRLASGSEWNGPIASFRNRGASGGATCEPTRSSSCSRSVNSSTRPEPWNARRRAAHRPAAGRSRIVSWTKSSAAGWPSSAWAISGCRPRSPSPRAGSRSSASTSIPRRSPRSRAARFRSSNPILPWR